MHVLIFSRTYPNAIIAKSGSFVKSQVEALSHHNIKIGVFGVYGISFKYLLNLQNILNLFSYCFKYDNITEFGFLYPSIPFLKRFNLFIREQIAKIRFTKYLKKYGPPDIIHLHTFEMGNVASWIKTKFNIPYMVTEHTSLFSTNSALNFEIKLAFRTYKNSAFNIAVSKQFTNFLNKKFNVKFNYLPNFVNTSSFVHSSLIKNKKIKRFINVAYLDKNKNQAVLIKAFNKNFKNDKNVELDIIGNGPEFDNLKKLIIDLELKNVNLLGYIANNKLSEYYNNSDVFVLSSNIETFGVVLIEAMSCGLPLVSTRSGGPESIIENNKLGYLCKIDDQEDLSNLMLKAMSVNFDKNYISNYANKYSYKKMSKKLLNIYLKIV